MDRLLAMRQFLAVAETGSLSGAARRLRVSQPAMSKAMAALEDHLGVRLLLRTTRRLSLTEAGQRYLVRVRIVLDEADAADAAARDESAALDGRLRLSAPPVYAAQVIIPRLAAFRATYPRLGIEMLLDDRRIDLVEEGVDLALRAGVPDGADMVTRRIETIARLLVAAPAYLERYGAPDRPERIADHAFIGYGAFGERGTLTFSRGEETVRVLPDAALTVSAAEGLRAALLAGLGIGVASWRMVAHELDDGRLRPLLAGWQLPPGEMWALFPQGRRPTARARVFADWLIAALATNEKPER